LNRQVLTSAVFNFVLNIKTRKMKTSLNKLIFEYQLEINYNVEEHQKLFSGLSKLDFYTHGFSRGSLNVISARKGNGLSTFLNTLLKEIALQTTIITKERPIDFLNNYLSHNCVIIKPKIQGKFFAKHEVNHLNESIKEFQNLPIFIKKKKKLSLDFLESYLSKNEDIDCVCIENLDAFLEKEKILFKSLKKIAIKYNVILVCFFELNQVHEIRPYSDLKPSINDFKKKFTKKSTLKNINNLIFIWRPEFYQRTKFDKTSESTEGKGELIVCKKNEEQKNMIVKFSGMKNLFSDLEDYENLNWVEKLKVLNS